MFSKKIPFYYFLICILATAAVTYIAAKKMAAPSANPEVAGKGQNSKPDCHYDVNRLSGFQHISPVLSAAHECEAENLMPFKSSVVDFIDNEKKSGHIESASVYVRRLLNDDWINAYPNERFHPGALLKVPELIAFLKMAESDPGLLDKKFLYTQPEEAQPKEYYSAKTLQPGRNYSIRELFHFMIVYSDNSANEELVKHMNINVFNKVFADLRLTAPSLPDKRYTMGSREYSKFLEVLYNAAYLTINASEFATELLAGASFKDGILKKLPRTVPVAHKMGEWGDGTNAELHDCGIVYIDSNPYVITVMTRGKDMGQLAETIGTISKMTYDAMLAAPKVQ